STAGEGLEESMGSKVHFAAELWLIISSLSMAAHGAITTDGFHAIHIPGAFESIATAVSPDGQTVAGMGSFHGTTGNTNFGRAFVWNATSGLAVFDGGTPFGVTNSGLVAGSDGNPNSQRIYRWTALAGKTYIDLLPGEGDTIGNKMSADGSVIVGEASHI